MVKYIALLRGINVGGKNTVPMLQLKELFVHYGFRDVITYINSGNIIFTSDNSDELRLKQECETLIANEFSLMIPVTIISVDNLADALAHAPSWWDNDKDAKHNAIFIIPPATADMVFTQVGTAKPEYEKVDYYGRLIFWSAPIITFSRTRWSKVVGSAIYNNITIRNANTVKQLLKLAV